MTMRLIPAEEERLLKKAVEVWTEESDLTLKTLQERFNMFSKNTLKRVLKEKNIYDRAVYSYSKMGRKAKTPDRYPKGINPGAKYA